tara:strand:+ start:138 stop:1787 length:1650 start_codon:yes stop_codon:yes gene_type:complete
MDSIVRIQSNEANNDFPVQGQRGTKNNVSFNLDSNSGVYDLSQSYVAVNVSVSGDNPTALGTTGNSGDATSVFNSMLLFNELNTGTSRTQANDFIIPPTTAVLVRNVQMMCSKGPVEVLNRVDQLRANEYANLRTKQSLESSSNGIIIPSSRKIQSGASLQPYSELVNSSDSTNPVGSIVRDHEIRIPLKEILNVGNQTMYDTSIYQNTKLAMRMNLDLLAATQQGNPMETTRFLGVATNPFNGVLKPHTNDSGGAVDLSVALSENFYSTYGNETIPYWINQKVAISCDDATYAVASQITKILKLYPYDGVSAVGPYTAGQGFAIPANRGRMVIEFDGVYAAAVAGGTIVGPLANPLVISQTLTGTTTMTKKLNKIELVCKRSMAAKAPAKLEYTRFIAEEDTFPAAQDQVLQRYYSIPPNCDAVVITMVKGGGIYTVAAGQEDVKEYRVTINGDDISNRPITMHGQLHKNLIAQTLNNLGHKQQSNLNQFLEFNFSSGSSSAQHKANTIMIPVPLSGQTQQLGLEIVPVDTKTFGGQLTLFKHVMASI